MSTLRLRARSIFQVSGMLVVGVLTTVQTSSAVGNTVVYELVGSCGGLLLPTGDGGRAPAMRPATGLLENCTGTGTGYLTVQNYVPGQPLSYANFVSLTYTSSVNPIPSGITRSTPNFSNSSVLTGTMPSSLATTPGPVAITLGWDASDLVLVTNTGSSGFWCIEGSGGCPTSPADFGFGSSWVLVSNTPAPTTVVPVLGTAALCALGLLLAGAGVLLARTRGTAGA